MTGVIAAIATTTACDSDNKTAPVRGGQLGAADFTYICGDQETDPQCNVDSDLAAPGEVSTFPKIAVGGRFGMSVKARSGPTGDITLDYPRPFFDFIDEGESHDFKAKRSGITSIMAISLSEVLDLTWVELVRPDHIKLIQGTPDGHFKDGSVKVGPGGVTATAALTITYKFRAVMADKDDKILAGSFPCMWTTSDAAIANITTPPATNIATVVSGKAGTATIHVTVGDLAGDIALTVN